MDPCEKDPSNRRPFVARIYRPDQTLHIPVSAVEIASSAAISLNAAATGSGRMGVLLSTWPTYTFRRRTASLYFLIIASKKDRPICLGVHHL